MTLGGWLVLSTCVAATAVVFREIGGLRGLVVQVAATHGGVPALGGRRVLSTRAATTAAVLLALVTSTTAVELDTFLALRGQGGDLRRNLDTGFV
jgi:hypothetical protein